jgi:hypothetical protein
METWQKHSSIFYILSSFDFSISLKKLLIKQSPKAVGQFLADACYNLLQGNISLSDQQKAKLRASRTAIRRAAAAQSRASLLKKSFILILPTLLQLVRTKHEQIQRNGAHTKM